MTESSADFARVPDAFERLWTPHRMVYVAGEKKPDDDSSDSCPFCSAPASSDTDSLIVARGQLGYVILNLYPYNPGHLLICPYRHCAGYTELTAEERAEHGELTAHAIRALEAASSPAGFNTGMNQGAIAGAGIAGHLHQHVVPRWQGDANFFPIIAQTKALPQVLGETRDLVARAWERTC